MSTKPRSALFPPSRELFTLVRAVADAREMSARISDADLGRLIGFESARTSRWKHGQIEVADAPRLLQLAQALDVELHLLVRVCAGQLSAKEALAILGDDEAFLRFVGQAVLLPTDDRPLRLTGPTGLELTVIRRAGVRYDRRARQESGRRAVEHEREATVLLIDEDPAAIEVFSHLTGAGSGLVGAVARSLAEGLVTAGRSAPSLIILDLFAGGVDGFAALRQLLVHDATRAADLVATSAVTTPELLRQALGCGAKEVVPRPLTARSLGRILGPLRRRH